MKKILLASLATGLFLTGVTGGTFASTISLTTLFAILLIAILTLEGQYS